MAPPTTRGARREGLSAAESALTSGKEHEQRGCLDDAARAYVTAAASASAAPWDLAAKAEALRRHASIKRRRQDFDGALELCRESCAVAAAVPDVELTAEAMNGLGAIQFERGDTVAAQTTLEQALALGGHRPDLRGRIQQNLGIVANIRGDYTAALACYEQSLEAFRVAGDARMCAAAYHNLGMINADQEQWAAADRYFETSLGIANALGDRQLRGHVLLNRSEVHLALQRYEDARRSAEEALQLFDELGVRRGKSEAYKFLGMLYRDTGASALAEARLQSAIAMATESGAVLDEAEATRELAILYQRLDRNQEGLRLLNAAHRLFTKWGARADAQDVGGKMAALERVYLDLVAGWGRSIESADGYTFGHSERVAQYADAISEALGWDEYDRTTVRLGAYLHDLGKVRVPHEILNKPGPLTREERDIMEMHPLYGLDMLGSVEFPWDVKTIVRSHHEKVDGSGYPDRLRGDEISVFAQVICVADVYDALTTHRTYRAAFPREVALAEMHACRAWWRHDVYQAFLKSVGQYGSMPKAAA